MSGALPLDAWDLAAAASLMVILGLASLMLKLGLEKMLLIASVRTVVQLLLIGLVLDKVFAFEAAWPVALVCTVMIGAAGRAAVSRASRTFPGAILQGTLTLGVVGAATAILGTAGIVGAEPWWRPQYLIPMLGMLLGNSLTGISLCLDALLESVVEKSDKIEAELSLGATRWEAARGPVSDAVRRGMIPILNSMTVVGIVALPGMMTGQILEGADPINAVRYQIVIMFLIAASTTTGAVSVALLTYRSLFNRRHQLLRSRVIDRKPG